MIKMSEDKFDAIQDRIHNAVAESLSDQLYKTINLCREHARQYREQGMAGKAEACEVLAGELER